MATSYNKKSPTVKRILREAAELASAPSADYHAAPLETNLFEWHFTLRGPPGTPYERGIYHGRITLPPTYPLRPPSFRFLTPSGRFEVNREICLSISEHHEDTWQPAWGVRTAVVALRGFMESEPGGQVGGLASSTEQRRIAAENSRAWRCEACEKCNELVLEECAAAAKEAGGEGASREEEKVPEGMHFAFKDEKTQDSGSASGSGSGGDGGEVGRAGVATPLPPVGVTPTPTQPTMAAPPHVPAPLPAVDTPWLDNIIWGLVALLTAAVARRVLA